MTGITTVRLDGKTIETREGLYAEVRRQLDLPDFFGANADALYDVLTSLSQHTVVTVCCPGNLRRSLGPYYAVVERVLLDAATATPALTVVFTNRNGDCC